MTLQRWSLNVQLLKSLRRELGWTQGDLARQADLSVRVVAKAEAGQAVAIRTADAMVSAFQQAGKNVTLTDLKCIPDNLVRQFLGHYARHQSHCIEHSAGLFSPDVVAVFEGDPVDNPIAGTYRGLDQLAGFFSQLFAIFGRVGGSLATHPEMRCIGNEVLAWGTECLCIARSTKYLRGFVLLRFEFTHGLITRFECHYEPTGVVAALEHWAREGSELLPTELTQPPLHATSLLPRVLVPMTPPPPTSLFPAGLPQNF